MLRFPQNTVGILKNERVVSEINREGNNLKSLFLSVNWIAIAIQSIRVFTKKLLVEEQANANKG